VCVCVFLLMANAKMLDVKHQCQLSNTGCYS